MRCYYLSDLHLESAALDAALPEGDVLIIAGDLCHARCLAAPATDRYAVAQRERVMRFMEAAARSYARILMVAGNHEPYEGVFDDTAGLLRKHLPGVSVLDAETIEIGGVHFFGATLWTDFARRDPAFLASVRKRMGEFFFVRKRARGPDGSETLTRFQPADALAAFDRDWAALRRFTEDRTRARKVVITHHAPSLRGLNPIHAGNGLDGAYASDLDAEIAAMQGISAWVHGHTHIRRTYRIGDTPVHVNCRGFPDREPAARGFKPTSFIDL